MRASSFAFAVAFAFAFAFAFVFAGCDAAPDDTLVRVEGRLAMTALPVAGVLLSVCGDTCYFTRAFPDGTFAVEVDEVLALDRYALSVHGSPEWQSYYVPLPAPVDGIARFVEPLPLVEVSGHARAMLKLDDSAQELALGDVTLSIPTATRVVLPPEEFAEVEIPLGIARLDTARFPIDTSSFSSVYGFHPFETQLSQATRVALPNDEQLAPGTLVELWTMRGLLHGPPPAGSFERAARAHVDATGSRIVTDEGEGLTSLSWVATRAVAQ